MPNGNLANFLLLPYYDESPRCATDDRRPMTDDDDDYVVWYKSCSSSLVIISCNRNHVAWHVVALAVSVPI
jgi:hypothetical protein